MIKNFKLLLIFIIIDYISNDNFKVKSKNSFSNKIGTSKDTNKDKNGKNINLKSKKLYWFFFIIITIILTFAIFSKINHFMKKKIESEIAMYIKFLSNELFLFFYVISIIKLINFFSIFKNFEKEIKLIEIEFLLTIFILFYIILNIILIIWCYLNYRRWSELESYVIAKEEIFKNFEKINIKMKNNNLTYKEKSQYNKNLNILKYIFWRNEFIHYNYTLMVKESLLRDDFNFNRYLGKALFKTLYLTMRFSIYSLVSFIIFFLIYFLIRMFFVQDFEIYILIVISIILFIIQNVLLRYIQNLFSKIHKQVSSVYDFNLINFDFQRGNNNLIDKICIPEYIKDAYKDYKIINKLANPQEKLFIFSNPNFLLNFIHIIVFWQIIWLIIFYTNYFIKIDSYWVKIICIFFSLFIFSNLFTLLPWIIKNFTLITNIQMMKDHKLIHEVINNQKKTTSWIFRKLFRIFKLKNKKDSYKNINNLDDKGALLNELIINQMREIFKNINNDNIYEINLEEIIKITYQISNKNTKEELLNFIQRCQLKMKNIKTTPNFVENEIIWNFQNLMEVIEEYKEESEIDSFKIVYESLLKINNNSNLISINLIETFLLRNKNFNEEEINIIVNELKYLQGIENVITIEKVCYLIDNYLTFYPK